MNNNSPYKVLSYHPNPYGESQLGFAVVGIKDRVQIIVKICKTKQGGLFACHPSTKVDGKWVSTFVILNKDADKALLDTVLAQVKPMLARQAPPPAPVPQEPEYDDGMPF